jgi:cytochrome P450
MRLSADVCDGKKIEEIIRSPDPFKYYAELRDIADVMYWERDDCYLVTNYKTVKEVMSDYKLFSHDKGVLFAQDQSPEGLALPLFVMAPPDQTRARRLAADAFSMKRSRNQWRAFREEARSRLAGMRDIGNEFEIVSDFAINVTIDCLLNMVGASPEQREKSRQHMRAMITDSGASHEGAEEGQAALRDLIFGRIAEASESGEDSFVSALVKAQCDGDRLTMPEIASLIFLGIFGGYEDVIRMLAACTEILSDRPDLRERIMADEEESVRKFVAEAIRFTSSTHVMRRTTSADTELGNVQIPRDCRVVTLIAGSNRDPSVFAEPNVFDIDRENSRAAMTFGSGPHVCIGQHVAREVISAVIKELAAAIDGVTVDKDRRVRVFANNIGGYSKVHCQISWVYR